jgi:hypothetical protein
MYVSMYIVDMQCLYAYFLVHKYGYQNVGILHDTCLITNLWDRI